MHFLHSQWQDKRISITLLGSFFPIILYRVGQSMASISAEPASTPSTKPWVCSINRQRPTTSRSCTAARDTCDLSPFGASSRRWNCVNRDMDPLTHLMPYLRLLQNPITTGVTPFPFHSFAFNSLSCLWIKWLCLKVAPPFGFCLKQCWHIPSRIWTFDVIAVR